VLFIVISVGVLFYVILPLLLHIGIEGRPAVEDQELNLEIVYDDDNNIFYIENKDDFDYMGFNLFLNDNPWYNIQIDVIKAGERIPVNFDELKTRDGIGFSGADAYVFDGSERRGKIKNYRIK
jgi:hypothetical protein